MCGRFVRYTSAKELTRLVGALNAPADPGASYNVAPTQQVLNAHSRGEGRVVDIMQWGLVPRWAKKPETLHPINARAETIATNGVFRLAFRSGRTLIPADGFYEWKRTEHGKQPYYVYRCDGRPMWFAGLSDTWRGGEQPLTTCAIITTGANEAMQAIHDRMPVVLFEESWDRWLDPDNQDPKTLRGLLTACDSERVKTHPVSYRVNTPKNDNEKLIEPVAPPA